MTRALGTCVIGTVGAACGPTTSVPTTRCLIATLTNIPERDGTVTTASNTTCMLKISDPSIPIIGTAILHAGGGGSFYETIIPSPVSTVVQPALDAGWRVVQVNWASPNGHGWFDGTTGVLALAGRQATLLKALYDDTSIRVVGLPFVWVGQSGGSTAIGYGISHYGMGAYVDLAVLCAGPSHSRIDLACLGTLSPSWTTLADTLLLVPRSSGGQIGYTGGDAQIIDASYGTSCTVCQSSKAGEGGAGNLRFVDSLMNGTAEYRCPNTDVIFIFGDADASGACVFGRLYATKLTGKTTHEYQTSGGVGHTNLPGSASGGALIMSALGTARLNH